jgi:hypothetical protein
VDMGPVHRTGSSTLRWRSSGAPALHYGMIPQVTAKVPLTTLLAWAWVTFTIEADNAVESAGSERVGRLFRISMPMWANALRYIDEEGITVDELHARSRAKTNVPGLERWGWVTIGESGPKRREGYGSSRGVRGDTRLRPTRAGSYARRLWPRTLAELEERWRERFGAEVTGSLSEALRAWAGAMPWAPPVVNPSDGFYTHVDGPGPDGPGSEEPAGEDRPLVVLMGQALTALTLEEETDAEVSRPAAANFLRVIGDSAVRTRDLPASSGVSKEAVAMAVNFLRRRHLAEAVPGGSVKLTNLGLDALDGFRARAARAKDATLQASLVAVVSQRQALAEGLVPPPGCWRGQKPYSAQTQRLLADPTAALPWHPMVLHRGGWPDGF